MAWKAIQPQDLPAVNVTIGTPFTAAELASGQAAGYASGYASGIAGGGGGGGGGGWGAFGST